MLIDFFLHLKAAGLPVSTREFLNLLAALQAGVIEHSLDDFHTLARTCLIKDEAHYDKFDRAFGSYFKGITELPGLDADIPEEWLHQLMKKHLTDAEKAQLEKLGWDKLMEQFKERLAEQKERHEGGNKWIGTGGSSPFGHGGYHPEGIRIGGPSAGNRTAIKVWEQREFRNLDDTAELGTRNIKVALRRLRHFARDGAAEELDLDGTIRSTAQNAGWLDLKMRPERHNKVKVLLFLDVGGSMDDHIQLCEELFSAARSEFKHLEHFYFHNCIYDFVWRDNRQRRNDPIPLFDVLNTYGDDYKLILVGDATMSPYEILRPGGNIEYMNEEAGAVWLGRLLQQYPHAVWLNPEPTRLWDHRQSIQIIRNLMSDRMFPLTLEGLAQAMQRMNK
ncbi:MAG: VWA domain-containing protein [Sterolibacterium sp.]|nr:VWA domain-containing protein [Sterolibacterium sp.]MBP9800200.1 VWA domain-containing protein [Sterolibacterium sp.]